MAIIIPNETNIDLVQILHITIDI